MKSNQASNNVIKFPAGRKLDSSNPTPNQPPHLPPPVPSKKSYKNLGAGVIAIAMFTVAVNRYVYQSAENSAQMSSLNGRGIASVGSLSELERISWKRDASWEKDLAEKLASANVQAVTPNSLGRSVSKEDQLRWGVLEEKYNINYLPNSHRIVGVSLNHGQMLSPTKILNATDFLNEYGVLFDKTFYSSQLKFIESGEGRVYEFYTLFDKNKNAKSEIRFEFDQNKHLISLKVQAI